jgi:hypothetical protein
MIDVEKINNGSYICTYVIFYYNTTTIMICGGGGAGGHMGESRGFSPQLISRFVNIMLRDLLTPKMLAIFFGF